MKTIIKFIHFLVLILLLAAISSSCNNYNKKQYNYFPMFSKYTEIPDITEDEILAIEALKQEYNYFIYGMPLSTEAFEDNSKNIGGFSALFCEWLTEFFGIPFIPKIFEWQDVITGLETGEISFSGELTPTEERLKYYHMTSAIAARPLKQFRLIDSKPIAEITQERLLRCGFIAGAATINAVVSELEPGTFEVVELDNFSLVYNALKSGLIDSFYYSAPAEMSFINYNDIAAYDFYPLIFMPVSLSTRTAKMESVISIVEKALRSGGTRYFAELYNTGYQTYRKHKLSVQLTEEERLYIQNNPIIPTAFEASNYPVSFYNTREQQWQGITVEILKEVEALTGLKFKRINNENANFSDLLKMLEEGEVLMLSEMMQTKEREETFLWTDTTFMTGNFALISELNYNDITLNEILYTRVGLIKDYAHTAFFRKWFPNHLFTTEYESNLAAFDALDNGKIDLVMASSHDLLILTHYLERPGYKINFLFDYSVDTTFGFNKDAAVLCSIINKAMRSININGISEQWLNKTYDYRSKLAEEKLPLLIGSSVLLLLVIALLTILFERNRRSGKRLEQLVKERTYDLEIANQTKSTFLANMSHEIRTPMNAILGVTEILIQNENISAETEEGLDKIYSSCNLLLGIINGILDFSKIEAGKLDIIPAQYKVASLINDSIHINMVRTDSKPIEFELHVDENIPSDLIGDELRIKQILNNILSNAFKYTDTGKITLSVSSELLPDKKDIMLVMSVQDTGHGMTKEQLKELFDEYSRFNQIPGKTIEGTGLGLAIVQSLTTLMNGKIHVESEPNKGTLFIIKLPQGMVGSEVLGKELAENLQHFHMNYMTHGKREQIKRDPMPYGSVLVVDDVETNLYVAIGLLKLYKLKIDTAISGEIAISKIKSGNVYDVVFMDHMMPEMDGIETTKYLRDLGYKNTIIALTANAVVGQADMFLQNGFDDFISKPIDIRQLNIILNKHVRDKQTPEIIEAARQEHNTQDLNHKNTDIQQNDPMLLESFIRDVRKAIALLSEETLRQNIGILENENILRKFTVTVHGMKSSLWNIGETALSELAGKLEQAVRSKNVDFILSSTPEFLNGLNALLEKYEQKDNTNNTDKDDNLQPEDIDDLQKRLRTIVELCENYNRKGLLDTIAAMDNNSKNTRAVLEKIKEHVIHSEFENAGRVTAAYLDELSAG